MSFHEKVAGIKNRVLNMPEYSEPINLLKARVKGFEVGGKENNRKVDEIEI